MVSHAGAVRDVIDAAVPRIVAILAAVLPIGLLAQVLGELGVTGIQPSPSRSGSACSWPRSG